MFVCMYLVFMYVVMYTKFVRGSSPPPLFNAHTPLLKMFISRNQTQPDDETNEKLIHLLFSALLQQQDCCCPFLLIRTFSKRIVKQEKIKFFFKQGYHSYVFCYCLSSNKRHNYDNLEKNWLENVSAHFLETPDSIPYLNSLFIIYWIATTPLREVNKIHFNPKKRGL